MMTVNDARRRLYGIVNNAGVLTNAPVLDTEMKEFDTVMSVNVYGPWRITRAFAPLVIASERRIINISSLNGVYAPPKTAAYAMSKHAIEALAPDAQQAAIAIKAQLKRLAQMNEDQPYTYHRDTLVKMLDQDSSSRSAWMTTRSHTSSRWRKRTGLHIRISSTCICTSALSRERRLR
jgi:hypothetical protein